MVHPHVAGLVFMEMNPGGTTCEIFSVADPDLPAKFDVPRSVNGGVVSGQTRPQTLLKL